MQKLYDKLLAFTTYHRFLIDLWGISLNIRVPDPILIAVGVTVGIVSLGVVYAIMFKYLGLVLSLFAVSLGINYFFCIEPGTVERELLTLSQFRLEDDSTESDSEPVFIGVDHMLLKVFRSDAEIYDESDPSNPVVYTEN
jgi:hypothetical protein